MGGRQFSEDRLVNYGVWGFLAGLLDYFTRPLVGAALASRARCVFSGTDGSGAVQGSVAITQNLGSQQTSFQLRQQSVLAGRKTWLGKTAKLYLKTIKNH